MSGTDITVWIISGLLAIGIGSTKYAKWRTRNKLVRDLVAMTQSTRLPEIVLYDHVGFKGAYARTNLSFHYVGDFWNDRISCLIVVNGVWRFYRDDYYKGPYWDLGPGYYESFFTEKGPDDVVSSFQAIALT